jgi:uncharacterized membrane protein HdeD (DUF308 family)
MGLGRTFLGILLCLFGLLFLFNGLFSGFTMNYVTGLILGVIVMAGGIRLIKSSKNAD